MSSNNLKLGKKVSETWLGIISTKNQTQFF